MAGSALFQFGTSMMVSEFVRGRGDELGDAGADEREDRLAGVGAPDVAAPQRGIGPLHRSERLGDAVEVGFAGDGLELGERLRDVGPQSDERHAEDAVRLEVVDVERRLQSSAISGSGRERLQLIGDERRLREVRRAARSVPSAATSDHDGSSVRAPGAVTDSSATAPFDASLL
ncbi:MAG: hypothetical protein R2715_24560 [Ilumatobacteraceae bacterium]